jgi:hypothetical protein
MKKLEIGLIVFFLASIILVRMHIDGAIALLGIALSALAVFYFLMTSFLMSSLSLREYFSELFRSAIGFGKVSIGLLAGICLSILLIGIQFKLLFWPGWGAQLGVGLASASVVFLVCIVRYFISVNRSVYAQMLLRLGFFMILGWAAYRASVQDIVRYVFHNDPAIIEMLKEYNRGPVGGEDNTDGDKSARQAVEPSGAGN